ncbi:MAG: LacI family DNA-binding transcriptional regulator [Blautia faecis]
MSGRMYMGATLNDIAKKVGVSQSTVSRVINWKHQFQMR